ncbi:pseudouridine synthase [Porphyromonas levii]|uniref:Pseudouridine synthase n=1 Tax=Porphyromonas levii TaxID=28114 RepID=A0A4Y8WRT0_9PORP|nr:pseudouridine synthase [Porphyromonas levii]TFH96910.1 pseudouridine synthase [Porphyromonas levii]TFH97219.1 pseudouridine synthase [Porphyromonas levii]
MEWNKIPPRKPLATSRNEGGEWNEYSREAGDTSSNASYDTPHRRYVGEEGSERGIDGQPRRRRRISEMQRSSGAPERSYQQQREGYRSEGDGYGNYQRERNNDRSEQHSYYKEQYNQVREAKRQRLGQNYEGNQERAPRGHNYGDRRTQGGGQRPNKRDGGGKNFGNKPRRQHENRPPVYEQDPIDISEAIRLNKFLSNAGVCSRREADELIKVGAVLVNGLPVTELGTKITAQDRVEVNGREVKPENKVYVLLNKPRNCVTTTEDPQERLTVTHLVRNACKERIYPVGRLDRNTTGVLLLTNDGDLAAKLVHPSFKKKKIYHVWLDKEVTAEDMQKIADGVELEDGEMHADAISYVADDDLTQVGIEIHSGRNRIVRRIFEHLGYHVKKLDRVYFAGLTKKNLGRGKWRYLTQDEVNTLLMGAFE